MNLKQIEERIAKLLDEVTELRVKRDAIKNPPNVAYREMLALKKQQRKEALKNYLGGMKQVEAVKKAGFGGHGPDSVLVKAWRENFKEHYHAQSRERYKIPYEEQPSILKWLKDHPPLAWESILKE